MKMNRWKLWLLPRLSVLFYWGLRVAGSVAGARYPRFLTLHVRAKHAFEKGNHTLAAQLSRELLNLADQYRSDWNYGNAIHQAHLVLGRVALADGNIPKACAELLLAGETPGSSQLDSFGPNMMLARDLVRAGERQAVVRYFELCGRFWKMGTETLAEWTVAVEQGREPNFGANLAF